MKKISLAVTTLVFAATFSAAMADDKPEPMLISAKPIVAKDAIPTCRDLPNFAALSSALLEARKKENGGFNLDMWGTIVNRDGEVCVVARTGANRGDQWPGSRVISAQKANTANAFSLPGLALSTANLYAAVQPGGSLFGLQESNPVDTNIAYAGKSANFGTKNDPLMGKKIGGVNVFGGGLALYNSAGVLVGAIGVSGDSSCADHNIAWRTRDILKLDFVPNGVAADKSDNIIFDMTNGKSTNGFGHPTCGVSDEVAVNTKIISEAPLK
jgi:uncharacterized protein GlcG (DUF336 family)